MEEANRKARYPQQVIERQLRKHSGDSTETWVGPVFIATPFTIAKTWKQPKCPLIDDWIKEIYTMEYYSVIKRMK